MSRHWVTSPDGTEIAYWTDGDGPPLVAVHGTTADHTTWRFVRPLLERHATLHAVDRRGRSPSGDGPEYRLEREFEDVAAVVRAIADADGGAVDLLGHSYGALCALGAARLAGEAVRRLVLYEPSPIGSGSILESSVAERLAALAAQGRSEELLETFYREAVGMSAAEVGALRTQPVWPARVAAAATIPRELAAEQDFKPAGDWFTAVAAPTLLLLGGESPPWAAAATEQIRAALPDARVEVMAGQRHMAIHTAPELFAGLVVAFLARA